MKIIGITGGVGAGKTQILEYLNDKYGATVCQADEVAKKLQKKGTDCHRAIVEHFGADILDPKGELNREKLAQIIFTDKEERAVLNGIVHPAVKEEIRKIIKKEERKHTSLFLLEAALLIDYHYEQSIRSAMRYGMSMWRTPSGKNGSSMREDTTRKKWTTLLRPSSQRMFFCETATESSTTAAFLRRQRYSWMR